MYRYVFIARNPELTTVRDGRCAGARRCAGGQPAGFCTGAATSSRACALTSTLPTAMASVGPDNTVVAPSPRSAPATRPRVLTPGATATEWTESCHGACLLRAVSPSLQPAAATDFSACGAVAISVDVREGQSDGAAEVTVSPAAAGGGGEPAAKRPRISSVDQGGCTLGCGQWWTEMELPVPPTPSKGIGLAAVVAPLDQHGRVLLTRRPRHMRTFPGCWVMPGGSVDPGESTLTAALRELHEETGLRPAGAALPSRPFAMWEVRVPPDTAACRCLRSVPPNNAC